MDEIKKEVVTWLHTVVIGLNLCPFSARPTADNRVRFYVSKARAEDTLLQELFDEMLLLDKSPPAVIETTLLIIPNFLQDFFDYHQFLIWAQAQLKRQGWQGVYQLASFHPHYCFAGAEADDNENLTNRSPYPIIHIIREASLTKAIEFFADVDEIPERNKVRVEALSQDEKRKLFPYLFRR